jgi:hypothetical protein
LFSSLLSNIKLDEFGKELERRYHRFDRYADDICIYPKSERADQRVLESVSTLWEHLLKFEVNHHKKCRVAPATKRGYLCGALGRTRTCDLLIRSDGSAVPWTPVGPLRPSFTGFY